MSELDHMDALAAEYVLGTLDFEEREQARTLLEADAEFAAKVVSWERRFGDLYLMVEPVEPDSAIWPRIRAKMLEVRERTQAAEQSIPAPAPAHTPAQPPSLDAIQAVISEAATTLSSEATSAPEQAPLAPILEVTPTTAAEATHAPASEPIPPPASEAISVQASEATPAPASEGASAPMSEMPPAPTLDATRTLAVEAVPSPPVAAASAEPAGQAPSEPQASSEPQAQTAAPAVLTMHRRLRRWQAFAVLMTLIVLAVAALLAAWRFAPDRVPPMLQPLELMRQAGVPLPAIPAPRRPAPPESRFDE
jgi:anti-sigma-K factor RskA